MPLHKTTHNGKVALTIAEVSTLTGMSSNAILNSASAERQSVRICIRPPSDYDIFSIDARTLESPNPPIAPHPHLDAKTYVDNRKPIPCNNIDLLVLNKNECKRLAYFGSITVSIFSHAIAFDQFDVPRAFPIPYTSQQTHRYLALGAMENKKSGPSFEDQFNLAKITIKIDDLLVLVSDLSFVVDLESINATDNGVTEKKEELDDQASCTGQKITTENLYATDEEASIDEMPELQKTLEQEQPDTSKTNDNVTEKNEEPGDHVSCTYPKITRKDLRKTTTWLFFKKPHYSLSLVALEAAAKEAWGKKYTDSENYITNKEVAKLIQNKHKAITTCKLSDKPATSMASLIRPDCGYGHPDSAYEEKRAGRHITNFFVVILEAADLFLGEKSVRPNPSQRAISKWLQTERDFPQSLADLGARLIMTKP